ncbi:MAG: bifunctional oligoribonuclease/PAP phosphatase NrnA [Candidatus Jettenia sp.]|uniref:Phosphoesterase domain-containing protein n=1 Tax=Candidatus Jettenia caeni TaxID=247490 RepID=I3IGL7_9BACT|nr:bifunctional oligoribonuclease/PAP phosphatase NrnA [Candidatus Jettenia sp. AMX1]MBC6927829.1 bifunctional oligoribonuclease/PAP phosphatase NrnA [Candidatus Jettenia sp.]WKZ16199.1 MAG: bifunctional oligoribonuclease/PAP phosphatase NrnA [Candidatus Jettenia caeni]KAA0251240.1 MAG: bifunctional oligoribonuclease/PAP phosphatase NrnA [Candidatus Jettenia sp. AMX1]MCE7880261.1 bifunctional oligoribonuclease/PAP phosphatase NrnA [Candidatus Jettenia sp. AMX1]MCQ3926206.1 bifunctional oligori
MKEAKDTTIKMYTDKIHDIIKRYGRFLLTTHVRSDGDGIGAEVALYYALKNMGKSISIANDSPIPQIFRFITPDAGMYIYPQLPPEQAEVVFTLDCPTLDRLGRIREIIPKDAIIINIDHHVSNEYFGNVNWVAEDMCSTGEIIFTLLKNIAIDITQDIATALYIAIVTDTGRFTHANTTPDALRIAAFLIEHGARHTEISQYVYNTNPFNLIQLNALVLNTVRLHAENRIATVWLTKDMLEKTHVNAIDAQEFADIPISIDGVSIGVLFREMTQPNWVKVSLRSRNGFDVNAIAKKFGGGGHKYAAGCEIPGSIAEVQQIILHELEKALLTENRL